MYPDCPESASDLVPLPHCDGPKLEPFDFQGPQEIEFLRYIGKGAHSHVFKVRILGQIYALKLFRFIYDHDWPSPENKWDTDDRDAFTAFANYAEPFNSECRAYGRLKETNCEHLANKCFGYLLLEEENEQTMMDQFKDVQLEFNGSVEFTGAMDVRGRFPGKDGRLPPIRGIIKEFGQPDEKLSTRSLRSVLKDMIQIQQLGIVDLDVADRQLINGKLADFSTAKTFPHFITSPELNPHLTPEMMSSMELETFQLSLGDYIAFDNMVHSWNYDNPRDQLAVYSLPGGEADKLKYDLRSLPSRKRVYTLADPRSYDWKSSRGKTGGRVTKRPWRPRAKPPRWYFEGSPEEAAKMKTKKTFSIVHSWHYKDGYVFPKKIVWW